jgi:hypothetical protein
VLVCWICGAKLPFAEVMATQRTQPLSQPEAAFSDELFSGAWMASVTEKAFVRRLLNRLATVLWVSVVVGCGYYLLRDSGAIDGAGNSTQARITLRVYEQLQTGMTYKECLAIIGTDGVQKDLTYVRKSGLMITTYIWQNADGSNIMAEFENNRLFTKVQAGLAAT